MGQSGRQLSLAGSARLALDARIAAVRYMRRQSLTRPSLRFNPGAECSRHALDRPLM